jgi:hypothetical protein
MKMLAIILGVALIFPVAIGQNQKDSLGNIAFPGSTSISIDRLIIDYSNPAVIYAVTNRGKLYKSTNSGEMWASSSIGIPDPITAFVIDPSDSRILYAGTQRGIYKSTNSGVVWESLHSKEQIFGIVIQNAAPPSIYLSAGRGLFRSDDGGLTWEKVGKNVDASIIPLAANPVDPTIMYAFVSRAEDVIRSILDDVLACKERVCEYEGDGLYSSKDRGARWKKISRLRTGVLSFVSGDSKSMYAGSKEVMKSVDGGETWIEKSSGIPKSGIRSLAIDSHNPGVLYAASNYSSGGHLPLYNWSISRAYKSIDGGETWEKISDFPVNCLVIEPDNINILYAATPGGGVFKSIDAGKTWKPSNLGFDAEGSR